MSKIYIADLFCGTGGFSKGFINENERFSLAFAIDALKVATETTKANHPDAIVLNEDIRKIKPSNIKNLLEEEKIPRLDLVIGGPPCQGFSSIRPFRSSTDEDPRNTLFEEYAKFINYFLPKAFVLENVVGITTHDNGRTLEQIQELFCSMGYDTDWRVINAANYGIPQKRERFILIGGQKGMRIRFPYPTHSFEGKTIGSKFRDKMIVLQDDLPLFAGQHPRALNVMDAIGDLPPICSGEEGVEYCAPTNDYQRKRRKNLTKLSMHDATKHSAKMLEIIKHSGSSISCIPPNLIKSGFSTCYSRLEADEPADTITVNFVHPASNKCIHPYQDRALTPREGARLQGFDDDYVFCGNRVQIVIKRNIKRIELNHWVCQKYQK